MIELTLGILLLILIGLGLMESHFHHLSLAQLPIRIHVNGSRGKSSVTRLIAAGLRAGGLKTLAKTTGTAPRIIDENGKDRIIHRLRSASIGEQVRLLRNFANKKPDAVVIECMAVNPQYQWVSEQKMIQSTVSVITNVRPDHLDEMGSTLEDIAMSLSNTIPFDGHLVTSEKELDSVLEEVSEKRNTEFNKVSDKEVSIEYMGRFPYLEHRDNVALALKVCELSGIEKDTALEGMLHTQPDPGATIIWKLNCNGTSNYFVNLLAANDPTSTLDIWHQLQDKINDSRTCIFLNTREDRRYRTNQLLHLIYDQLKPDSLIVRGENMGSKFHDFQQDNPNIKTHQLPYNIGVKEMVSEFSNLENYFIVGIGNMVGWGEKFVQNLKEYRI
ncbi:MAG: poly-gamma-glutamate synthase PgsB [Candidatus Marinimicrobia bacterium]|nr:poly-gamma-glutamate synthase PgsB [Candidatus Neomarinimicrobiota bacterium]